MSTRCQFVNFVLKQVNVMRKPLWAAVLLVPAVVLALSVFGLVRSYQEVRAFAEKIHAPLELETDRPNSGTEPAADEALPVIAAPAEGDAIPASRENPYPAKELQADAAADESAVPSVPVLTRVDDLNSGDPFVLLLIGVDRRPGDRGRSDALIAAAINPAERSTLIVSIPRDTRTAIVGLKKPVTDKINHAYAFGGVESTVATAERFLGVPVSRYVLADMEGFRAIVDLLGGVQVDNKTAFEYEGHFFGKGSLHLDGEEALAYVRMRKTDPRGDLGRGDRQKAVVRSLISSALQPDNFRKWPELLDRLSEYIRTDLTFDDWKTLALDYRKAAENVETDQIAGRGLIDGGIYYFSVSEEERTRISERLAAYLQKDGEP